MADSYEEMLMNQSAANSAFNAEQAQINRDWQEYMSGTSHQREVNDLIAAGLNPVLSANSGSTWQGVSNASADPSSIAAISNLATTAMNNQTQLEMSKISAEATKAAADATSRATMSAAGSAAAATMAAAGTSAAASKYVADRNYESATYTAPVRIDGPFGIGVSGPSGAVNNTLSAITKQAAELYPSGY